MVEPLGPLLILDAVKRANRVLDIAREALLLTERVVVMVRHGKYQAAQELLREFDAKDRSLDKFPEDPRQRRFITDLLPWDGDSSQCDPGEGEGFW